MDPKHFKKILGEFPFLIEVLKLSHGARGVPEDITKFKIARISQELNPEDDSNILCKNLFYCSYDPLGDPLEQKTHFCESVFSIRKSLIERLSFGIFDITWFTSECSEIKQYFRNYWDSNHFGSIVLEHQYPKADTIEKQEQLIKWYKLSSCFSYDMTKFIEHWKIWKVFHVLRGNEDYLVNVCHYINPNNSAESENREVIIYKPPRFGTGLLDLNNIINRLHAI